MKKLLLATAVSALSIPIMADVPEPLKIEDANVYAMSANGEYIVASGTSGGSKIFNLSTGQMYDYSCNGEDGEEGAYYPGMTKCVSDNGIVVGSNSLDQAAYWMGGEWYLLEIPSFSLGNTGARAITPDGSRICGNVAYAALSMNDDTLMQIPVVWDWDAEKGTYGKPVLLPHPDLDFSGRVPQYITASDISADGKTIIGQVRTATGMVHYPIVYTQDEAGEWEYHTLLEDKIIPGGASFPEYPGENPAVYPNYEDYMTAAERQAYNKAMDVWYESGFTGEYPDLRDFMAPAQWDAFEKAQATAEEVNAAWEEKFIAWVEVFQSIQLTWADFEFNSIRLSNDGKTFANTMLVPGEPDYEEGYLPLFRNVWVYDIDGTVLAKYDQDEALTLTCLANGGVAFATTYSTGLPNAFVLANGDATAIDEWISAKVPSYRSWMDENLTYEAEQWVPTESGGWDVIYTEEFATGRAYATPDLSKIALGVENYWDGSDDGVTCIFDLNDGSAVSSVRPAETGEIIYDLSGRRLKSADAPGIYIINGEKKAVR